AALDQTRVLWLPSVSIGASWVRHDGQIQDTRGDVINVSRSALFNGGGAAAIFKMSDALYEPLAARQVLAATRAEEAVATNDTMLNVAFGYWELIRAHSEHTLAKETADQAKLLDDLAQSYLRAEKIRPADAERVRAEHRTRTQEMDLAWERILVVSAKLAQTLRLDPFVVLAPADQKVVPTDLGKAMLPPGELSALALGNRPDLARSGALVALARERLRQARFAPLLPSVLLSGRAGGLGGGPNSFFGNYDGRSDFDAAVFWEFRNLGLGDRALQRQRDSEVRQAQIQQVAEMDRVVAEVAVALGRLQARQKQLKTADLAQQSAMKSHELSFKLFKDAGIEAIRPIEVLQSLQALNRTRLDFIGAVVEHNRAQFQLHWSIGFPVTE
ncbi:MAG: TolC family protein, partial [Planctomycetes bacterium]|nr:TolC family protein [Planctomycetota bacterium]